MGFQEADPRVELTGQTRRWFADDTFELMVWITVEGHIESFQLYYDKDDQESVIVWHRDRGWSHRRVETGQDGSHGLAPVLGDQVSEWEWRSEIQSGAMERNSEPTDRDRCPMPRVMGEFRIHSAAMEPHIRDFVWARLAEYFTPNQSNVI